MKTCTTVPGLSEHDINGNKRILYNRQIFGTGAEPSDAIQGYTRNRPFWDEGLLLDRGYRQHLLSPADRTFKIRTNKEIP